jgi:hypothetical protein
MNWTTLERTYPLGRSDHIPEFCQLILTSDQRMHILLCARAFAQEVGRWIRVEAVSLIANVYLPQVELIRTSP